MTALLDAPADPSTHVSALLRLATAGSVDDGKSTLVGRLLYDTKSVLADQYEAVERTSRDRGLEEADLALLTDGLRSEREQGITIDVAYRYFATPRRRFILADTPGHVQYTRNMVTGASTAQLAVILVDARKGLAEQTRRHTAVSALLRVPRVLLAVNKMDLVDFDKDRFHEIEAEFAGYASSLGIEGYASLPVSALRGDNVVEPSADLSWFEGPTLLEYLETVPVGPSRHSTAGRFPVQYVIRHQKLGREDAVEDYRGYAGTIATGGFTVGDEVVVLPSGQRSTISGIDLLGRPVARVSTGQSATLLLADDLDVSRGDLIAPAESAPEPVQDVEATVCHLSEQPLRAGDRVLLKHTTRTVKAIVKEISDRLDIASGERESCPEALQANDIGRVVLRTASPILLEPYAADRETGSFLLINPSSGDTLTAGMSGDPLGVFRLPGTVWSEGRIAREMDHAHRVEQDAERLEAGDEWVDMDLVYSGPKGLPIPRSHDWEDFKSLCREADVPEYCVHDTRHAAATATATATANQARILRNNGGTPKAIARSLGMSVADVVAALKDTVAAGSGDEPQRWTNIG